ncbi:MAG TPA: PEP/pyruvate-binding domain-containing protein [Gemmataceae bacterium]|nr:PEP/pyruvate-binding domain-containing protein [Gemmataceae bacterium]
MGQALLLGWEEAAAAGARRCGGKGWNLGRLHRYGFRVPAGAVLVADAYDRHLATPAPAALRTELAAITAERATDPAINDRLQAMQSAILAQPLPPDVEGAVRSFLAASGLGALPLAVRTSATAEDSANASFAGIHRSFLNRVGAEQIIEAVKGCYASLWAPAALAYRRRLGLADRDVACAVVLCAMVRRPAGPPAAAGVAFSCDPRTGRRDLTVINAVHGLGEDLVSGRVEPEQIDVLFKAGRLQIGGRNGRRVLDDARALELGRLTLRVLWALGEGQVPQDVEWVHDGERFWVVQARPVVRPPHPTFAALAGAPVIWSNANLAEVVPGVPTTLTWSVVRAALWEILYAAPEAVGYVMPPGVEMVRRFHGRLYFDVSAVQWGFYDCFGLLPAETNRALGGHQPEVAVPAGSPLLGRAGPRRLLATLRLIGMLLVVGRTLPGAVAALYREARRVQAHDLTQLSDARLIEFMEEVGDGSLHFGDQFQRGNAAAGAWLNVLGGVLERVARGRGPALAGALMAGFGQVTSAAHGYRLYDLADDARRDPAARDYLAHSPLDPHGWRRLPPDSPFRAGMEQFLAEFGHRAVNEIEINNPRWNDDPTYLLEQVRFLLAAGPGRPPREAARAARAAAEAEAKRRTFLLRPLVRFLATRARHAAGLREAGKSAMMALWEAMRGIALEIGRRMTAAGALDAPQDVVHMATVDWESFLRGEWDGRGGRALVADRKAQGAAWLAQSPPSVLVFDAEGRPAALPSAPAAVPSSVPGPHGAQLRGLGVSAGRASGPARVLRHPDEGARLQNGDVLVAPSTDPGWTPLFLRASALVLEVGGYLSHGAIVAREYGLPAVANVPGVLTAVRDGQRLTVDGDAGRVELG